MLDVRETVAQSPFEIRQPDSAGESRKPVPMKASASDAFHRSSALAALCPLISCRGCSQSGLPKKGVQDCNKADYHNGARRIVPRESARSAASKRPGAPKQSASSSLPTLPSRNHRRCDILSITSKAQDGWRVLELVRTWLYAEKIGRGMIESGIQL